jgi:MFS transporter, DHA2 family, glioxin efflux transporter
LPDHVSAAKDFRQTPYHLCHDLIITSWQRNQAIFSTITGSVIAQAGYFQPFLTLGGLLTTIAAGLIYTLDIDTSYTKDLGYQAIFGIGNGLCIQVPLIACQTFSDPADIPVVTAIVLCELPHLLPSPTNYYKTNHLVRPVFQTMGGALFVSGAQSIFANRVLQTLPTNAPGIDPAQLLAIGATQLRESFSPAQLPGILESYITGLRAAWALGIALAGVSLCASFGPEMRSIKGNAKTESNNEARNLDEF